MGQKFPTAGTCRAVDVGSKGAQVKILKYGGTAAGAYAHHRGPRIASLYTISKPRQASELK